MSRQDDRPNAHEPYWGADIVPGEGIANPYALQSGANDSWEIVSGTYMAGLPDGNEAYTYFEGEEVPVSSLRVRAMDKAKAAGAYTIHKAQETASDHPTAVKATVVSVAGLIALVGGVHVRRTRKK